MKETTEDTEVCTEGLGNDICPCATSPWPSVKTSVKAAGRFVVSFKNQPPYP